MSSGFCGQTHQPRLGHCGIARAQRGHAAPLSLLKKKKERQRAREELAFCQQERDGGASLKNLPTHHRRVFCMEPRPELFRTQGDPASGKGQPKACGESRQSPYTDFRRQRRWRKWPERRFLRRQYVAHCCCRCPLCCVLVHSTRRSFRGSCNHLQPLPHFSLRFLTFVEELLPRGGLLRVVLGVSVTTEKALPSALP